MKDSSTFIPVLEVVVELGTIVGYLYDLVTQKHNVVYVILGDLRERGGGTEGGREGERQICNVSMHNVVIRQRKSHCTVHTYQCIDNNSGCPGIAGLTDPIMNYFMCIPLFPWRSQQLVVPPPPLLLAVLSTDLPH